MKYSDQQILSSIRKGEDERILSVLYKYELPKVLKFISGNNGDEDEAKDIFQDAILIFYRQVKLNKFNEKYEIGAFIYSVSRNLWINRVKRKNRQINEIDEEKHLDLKENVLDDLITKERENKVNELISHLGESCQKVLTFAIYYKLSMKEIAAKMGFNSENVAKTKHYKCKRRLAELIKQDSLLFNNLKE